MTPGLWSSIQTALDGSEYFVLLASPEAARSPWVNREIEHWIATKSADRVLPVVTEGEWAWDNDRGDFTEESTAVPPSLRGVFAEEPFFLDLRWARGSEHLSLHHSRFRDAIAQLAAPMHGVSKDELEGEDVRQHRRARRLRSGAAATLVVLAMLATLTGVSAVHNATRAKDAAAEALRQRQVADGQRDNAERSAAEARRQQQLADQQQELANQQRARASRAATEASRSEQLARQQQESADQASAEAKRQQDLADRATTRTQEQQKLAKEASDRAQRLQQEARRQAAAAAEQRRLADRAAAEAKAQQAKADQQRRIAISRRLMNQAAATVDDDPATALRLGTAAQSLDPGAETRRQFSGVVTATHYAGTIGDASASAFGADGVLATAGGGGLVSLWDVSRPWSPVRIATLTDTIMDTHLEFSPDRRTLAFLTPAHQTVLWDVSRPSHPVRQSTLIDTRFIRDFALSGDGITAATGDSTGAVSIWDITDRTRPARLVTLYHYESDVVVRVAFTPSGRFLMVEHEKAEAVYDLTDRAHPASAEAVSGYIPRNAFSPDGSTMAFGKGGGSLMLRDMGPWNKSDPGPPMDPGEPYDPGEPPTWPSGVPVPPGHPTSPAPPATSAATQSPASDPSPTSTPPTVPALHNDRVLGLVSPTGSTYVPQPPPTMPDVDDDPALYTDEPLNGLSGTVTALAFAPSGTHVFAGDENGTVGMWDYQDWKLGTPQLLLTMHAHTTINTISVDPKTGLLATADISRTTTLWYVPPTGEPDARTVLDATYGNPMAVSVSADNSTLIAANSMGKARVWNIHDLGHPVARPDLTLRAGGDRKVAFSPDQRRVATFDDGNTLRVADLARPDRAATLFTVPTYPGVRAAVSFTFSPDGRTVAAVAEDEMLQLWDVADLSHPVLRARVNSPGAGGPVAFSPDGRVLAVADTAAITTLWNVSNRSAPVKLSTLTGHSEAIEALAFSADGRSLATGGRGGAPAILWDVSNPARPGRLASLTGAGSSVGGLAFSADGRTLATVADDNAIVIWDSSSPAEPIQLVTIKAPTAGRPPMAFVGGGTLAVQTQPDTLVSHVTLWDFGKLESLRADPAKYACGITGRGFDTVEWKRFIPELPYQRTCSQ